MSGPEDLATRASARLADSVGAEWEFFRSFCVWEAALFTVADLNRSSTFALWEHRARQEGSVWIVERRRR